MNQVERLIAGLVHMNSRDEQCYVESCLEGVVVGWRNRELDEWAKNYMKILGWEIDEGVGGRGECFFQC